MKRRLGLTLATVLLVLVIARLVSLHRHAAGALAPPPPPTYLAATMQHRLRLPSGPEYRPRCEAAERYQAAAADNAASVSTLVIAPFGRPETGWAIYAPLIGQEVRAPCDAQSSAFAEALSRWQSAHAENPDGRIRQETLSALATLWLQRRPFVQAMRRGCPPSPDPSSLEPAASTETFGGKLVLARSAALSAYRQMTDAARREVAVQPPILTLASGYRGPEEEAQRCADGSCGTASKARCSAHRTGLAFDLYLGAAPGFDAFSSDDANRRFQTQTPVYRWLVAHAGAFGFVPYPFEPWHWEWTGAEI